MSLRLYMDHHVHTDITKGVRRRGVDVITAYQDGRSTVADPILLDRATELGRVLFSQDKDLLREATRRQRGGLRFSGVVYAAQLRLTIGQCIEELEVLCGASEPEDMENQVRYFPI